MSRDPHELGRLTVRWIPDATGASEYQVLAEGNAQNAPWLAGELRKLANQLERQGWGFVREHPELHEPEWKRLGGHVLALDEAE